MTGRVRLPFGFSNTTRRSGASVIKEYEGGGARDRLAAEVAALSDVADLLAVPRILETTDDPPTLRTEFVDGEPAATRLNPQTLHTIGAVLCEFQAAYQRRTGRIRVHGDFSPSNLLLGPAGLVVAVMDWEWSRLGDAITDAAWMEWVLRMHYPGTDIAAFYRGYGGIPPWPRRHLSMMDTCRLRRDHAVSDPLHWQERLDATACLEQLV